MSRACGRGSFGSVSVTSRDEYSTSESEREEDSYADQRDRYTNLLEAALKRLGHPQPAVTVRIAEAAHIGDALRARSRDEPGDRAKDVAEFEHVDEHELPDEEDRELGQTTYADIVEAIAGWPPATV